MDSFNLNSDSYTEIEIEELFNLNNVYNLKDITNAKAVLIRQLTQTRDLGVEKQREIMFFIDTIANRILNKINNTKQNTLPYENKIITQGTNFIIETPDSLAGKHSDFTNGRVTIDSTPAPPGYINPMYELLHRRLVLIRVFGLTITLQNLRILVWFYLLFKKM